MPRLFKRFSDKVALAPGTILETEELKAKTAIITVMDYTDKDVEEKKIINGDDCLSYKDKPSITWINIEGMDIELIKKIDDHFGIHPLVAEDIVNTGQRPKVEDYTDYAFIVIKMIYPTKDKMDMYSEQVSLILGKNYVISFQEKEGDVFDSIRKRIRKSKGIIRKMGADYLAYSLLDAVVDNYFLILEKKGDRLEILEEELMAGKGGDASQEIHHHKRDMIFLRKQIWPLREVLSSLQRGECSLIKEDTRTYLRDVYDHTVQVMDTIESFRDVISGMHDVHMTNINNKMNETMKVLTIFASIFIPLTFMAGIYGMNFEYMPELKWKWSYFILLASMVVVVIGMISYFKKKRWF